MAISLDADAGERCLHCPWRSDAQDDVELEARARAFAISAHDRVGQRRKYTGAPYWTHPLHVAEIVHAVPHTPEMIAAALLHDTVEDTGTSLETIAAKFGEDVAELVEQLTDVSDHEDGNRAARKAIDCAHSAKASAAAKTVKLADLISNSESIVAHDPGFARVYLERRRCSASWPNADGWPPFLTPWTIDWWRWGSVTWRSRTRSSKRGAH